MSSSRCRPESRMSRTYSSWRSLSSPNIRSSSTSENPMTAFSGVRSSCDMLARNSDLCRPATSSSRSRCWRETNSWTFWIAIAPCAAKVVTSSTVRSSKAATRSRHSVMTPITLSAASIGTPSIVRKPPSSLRAVHLVVGIGERVEDLDGPAPEPDPADQRSLAADDRDRGHMVAVRLRPADREREPVHVAVEQVDLPGVRAAQPDGLSQHRLEHRLELERRAPDDLQHLGRGRLALARLDERALQLLDPLVGHIAGDFTEST